jgi:hypothetical protein
MRTYWIVGLVIVGTLAATAAGGGCGGDDTGCTPNCAGRECGWDPACGTQSCGTCPADRPNCNAAAGLCSAGSCTPNCGGRECGMDPVCGTLPCGNCVSGEVCTGEGICSDPCAPNYSCETCSPVGGCGWCETTWTCMAGTASGPNSGSCGSWRFEPSQCGDDCTPCVRSTDCSGGASCLRRFCDGASACYATPSSNCPFVGGEPCPEVSAYEVCSASYQCGPYADCQSYADGTPFCQRRCTVDADCPPVRTDLYPSLTPRCNTTGGDNHCFLECPGPSSCPPGLSCFRYSTGDYGYCG